MAVPGGYVLEEAGFEPASCAVLRSQVACAVLGLVIEKPSHGYEIGQRFERRFGGFLSVGRSSIYAALGSPDGGCADREDGRPFRHRGQSRRQGRRLLSRHRSAAHAPTEPCWPSACAAIHSAWRCWDG